MIIGNGDIAKVLPDRDDITFFASGVSNSLETRSAEFEREKELLFTREYEEHIVYFSSLCIFYSDTAYAKHKKRMERYVRMWQNWTIIRLGNIDWGTNPHTLINFLQNEKDKGNELVIKDEFRYVVDKEEFLYWVSMIPEDFNCDMNVPGRRLTVKQIVDEYVK